MRRSLYSYLLPLVVILFVMGSQSSWAQVGCGGFNGAPSPSGGAISLDNGQLCLNKPGAPGQISITASNVADGSNPNNFAVEIDWDDGSARQIIPFGGAITVNNTGPHTYVIPVINHNFLARPCNARPGAECSYRPRVFLRIAGVTCPAQFGTSPDFFRFNTDDQCSGDMTLSEQNSGATVFEVCEGATTTVRFTDRTRLNCLPPQELTALNFLRRHRSFTYGTTNTITGNVTVAAAVLAPGATYTPPGMPVASNQPLSTSAPPYANNNTEQITIPNTAIAGQEFHIRMDYWNQCNPYGTDAPVSEYGIIRVVAQPAPPTPVNQDICNGTPPAPAAGGYNPFRINIPGGGNDRVFWYQDNAGVPGAALTNPNGNNNTSFPAASVPGFSNTAAGVHRVWASYRRQVNVAGLRCESDLVPVTITVRNAVPVAGPIAGDDAVCNGETGIAYGVPNPANPLAQGGPTEYVWDVVNSGNTVVTDVTLTPTVGSGATAQNITAAYSIANGTFGGGGSVVRKIRVRRKYVNAPFCESTIAEFPVTVSRNTAPGTTTGGGTFCAGANLGTLTWNTPGFGSIVSWERATAAGGPWATVPSFGTSSPINATTLGALALPVGTHYFRAQVRNGECATVPTPAVLFTITANPAVADAGALGAICVPAGPLTYNLSANAPGGATSNWTQVSGPGTSAFSNASSNTSSVTVSTAGVYVFRWTLSQGLCTSEDEVEIQFGRDPAVPAPITNTFCGLNGTLTATAPVGGELAEWTFISGPPGGTPVIDDDTQVTTDVTVNVYGTYRFELTYRSGSCAPQQSQVDYTFYQPATSLTENDKTVCVDASNLAASAFAVTGTIGGGAVSGRWETTGTGTFASSGAAIGSVVVNTTVGDTYRPSAGDYATGSVSLRLVAIHPNSPPCANVPDLLAVTFDKKPADASVNLVGDVCGTTTVLSADAPTEGGIGQWSVVSPASLGITDPADRNSGASNLDFGANVFQWTVSSALGVCAPTTDNLTINRINAPTANSLTPAALCETAANSAIANGVDLTTQNTAINGGSGNAVQWFRNAARTIAVPTPTSEDVSDGEIFYVRVNTGGVPVCSSDATVTYSVTGRPFVGNLNPSVCETVAGTGVIDNVNLTTYDPQVALAPLMVDRDVTWFTDAALTLPVANEADVDGVTDGDIYYARVENTAQGCFNTATVTFSINPIPAVNPIVGPNIVCHDPAVVVFYTVTNYHPGYTYQWTVPAGVTVSTGSTTDFYLLLQFPTAIPGGFDLEVVETSPEGCAGAPETLHVDIETTPGLLTITGPAEVCEFEADVVFSVPVIAGTFAYSWNVPPGSSIILGQGTNEIHVNFGDTPGNVTVTPSTSAGCSGTQATQVVAINERPILAMLDKSVCSQSLSEITLDVIPSSVPATSFLYRAQTVDAGLFTINNAPTPPNLVTPLTIADNHIYNDQFQNITATPLNVRYTVSGVSAKNCVGPNTVITLVVNPEPQLDPLLGRSVCSDEETGITLVSAVNTFPADRFIFTAINAPAGVTIVNPGTLPTADGTTQYMSDAILQNIWVNTTGINQTVTYHVLPYSTLLGCAGAPPTPVSVTIYPQTTVDPVTVAPLCNGTPLNVTFSSTNNPDAAFHWRVVTYDNWVTVGSPASGVGNITNLGIVNTSSTQDGTVTFEVYGKNSVTEESAAGCSNPVATFTVTVNRKTEANDQLLAACSDAPGGNTYTANLAALESSINAGAGTPDVQIRWYASDPSCSCVPVIPVGNLGAYVMTDGMPVYAEVLYVPTGCRAIAEVEYDVNPNVALTTTLSDFTGFNLNCTNDKSGQIRIDVTAGTPVYSYRVNGGPLINAGANTYTFSSLDAGNYTVEVQDAKGCTASSPVVLVEPPVMAATLTEVAPISCFLMQDGSLSTQVTGGTGTYTQYLLLQTNAVDADNDGIFTGLGKATYNVRITDSNGCKVDSSPLDLDHPAAVEIDNVSVLADANGFNLSCRDAVDGEVALTFSGGNVPNNYTLTMTKASDPANPISTTTAAHNHTFTGLGFGNYTIVAEDAKGCPSLPAIAIIVNPPPFSPGFIGINQAVCAGDDAAPIDQLVPAFGGVGNYQYQWQLSLTGSMNDAEWVNIPAATATTYDPGVLAQTTFFRRLASSVSARTGIACEILGKDNIVQVTVNPLPVVAFNAPSEVCQGESFSLLLGMTGGAAPIEYDYSAGATTFLNMIGTENTMIPVSNFQAAQDYTLLRVKDLNGCLAANVPQLVHVDVIRTNSDFTVLAPAEQCSGGTFSFQWSVEAGVKYTWVWSDGSQDVVNDGDRPLGNNTITHVFTSGNTQTSTPYPVRLQAENALCSPKFTTKNITILPSVRLNIIPGDTILCSGESIRFIDQSEGVDVGRWYYRPVGSGEERDVRSGPLSEVTYQMFNNTTTNPIFYEVVYEASNSEGCGDTYSQELKVYRGITAGILNTPDPPDPFVGGISTLEFTNNSAPLDLGDFEYTWDFDDARATPPTGMGINPITVDYFKAGVKNVKLTAVNILSRDENNTCASTVIKPINIMLPTVGAAFRATPLASCFPVNVTVENLSPGADTFLWELYDQTGLVGTSNLREPEFRILTPGVYDIYLTASYYSTGQTATAVQRGIEVFDVPTALFEMRPNPLYVPDTELQTFNKSARATEYHWDFDDGTLSNEFEPRHFYKLEGKYNVMLVAGTDYGAKDIDGDGILDGNVICYDTVRNELVALDGGFVKLPNAFTPSVNGSTGGVAGNGTFNDVFLPIARGVEEFEMQIFDRWGNMIFETQDRNVGWDGYDKNRRQMPAGVYVYKLIMRLSNGQRTTKIGDVTLIR